MQSRVDDNSEARKPPSQKVQQPNRREREMRASRNMTVKRIKRTATDRVNYTQSTTKDDESEDDNDNKQIDPDYATTAVTMVVGIDYHRATTCETDDFDFETNARSKFDRRCKQNLPQTSKPKTRRGKVLDMELDFDRLRDTDHTGASGAKKPRKRGRPRRVQNIKTKMNEKIFLERIQETYSPYMFSSRVILERLPDPIPSVTTTRDNRQPIRSRAISTGSDFYGFTSDEVRRSTDSVATHWPIPSETRPLLASTMPNREDDTDEVVSPRYELHRPTSSLQNFGAGDVRTSSPQYLPYSQRDLSLADAPRTPGKRRNSVGNDSDKWMDASTIATVNSRLHHQRPAAISKRRKTSAVQPGKWNADIWTVTTTVIYNYIIDYDSVCPQASGRIGAASAVGAWANSGRYVCTSHADQKRVRAEVLVPECINIDLLNKYLSF